jgi:Protein kinase domain
MAHDDAHGGPSQPTVTASGPAPVASTVTVEHTQAKGAPLPVLTGFAFRRLLGTGGQAAVYEVKTEVGQVVALKTPLRQHADERAIARFRQEAEVMARFKHPHLVQLYAWGERDGWPYFTMPVYGGGTLKSRLAEFQANPERAVTVMIKVADAVHYLHSRGAVHRDLKPNNVLLDEAGEPHLSDFGLVKFVGDATYSGLSPVDETRTGCVQGTLPYMPPEQAAGANWAVGPHWDVWSLGVMLYELLTGQRPYEAPDAEVLLRLIDTSEPPRPRSLKPSLDPELEAIILGCLQREPTAEYSSAAKVAARLRAWLAKHKRPGWLRRHRWASGIALACIAAVAITAPFLRKREPDREQRLQSARAALARGETVALVADGKPAIPVQFLAGRNKAVIAPDATSFNITAADTALLELLDDPGIEHYYYRARLRSEPSSRPKVGLYFARQTITQDGGTTHFVGVFRFQEPLVPNTSVSQPRDVSAILKQLPKGAKVAAATIKNTAPDGDRSVEWGGYFLPNPDARVVSYTDPIATPAMPLGGWDHPEEGRLLEVEVAPAAFRLSWDGKELASVTRPIDSTVIDRIAYRLEKPLDAPLQFSARGGLGLYIDGGSVDVLSAEIVPVLDR